MSGGYPIGIDVCNGNNAGGSLSAYTKMTSVTCNATANTKGSWISLIASTPFDACYIALQLIWQNPNAGLAYGTIDIGIGAGGSQIVILADIAASGLQNTVCPQILAFPLQIPKGTQIWARCQSSIGAAVNTFYAQAILFDGSFDASEGTGGSDSYGFASGAPTTVTPGVNAMGSWTQIGGATKRDYIGLFGSFASIVQDTVNYPFATMNIGITASQSIIIPQYVMQYNIGFYLPFIPVNIPAGTALYVQASSALAADTIGVVLNGVYK